MTLTASQKLTYLAIDLIAILIFAAIGRASHGLHLFGVFITAAPFLMAAGIGFMLSSNYLQKFWTAWLTQWMIVANLGIGLRILLGGGFAVSFWAVTLLFTGLILLVGRFIAVKLLK